MNVYIFWYISKGGLIWGRRKKVINKERKKNNIEKKIEIKEDKTKCDERENIERRKRKRE